MAINLEDIPELSPNTQALPYLNQLIEQREKLKVKVHLTGGAIVIDCGIDTAGSYEAGVLFARICLGGLAEVKLSWGDFGGLYYPAVEVTTDHPLRACMASQYAGWVIKKGNYFAMGSGPARARAGSEELFAKLEYKDSAAAAILCLEGRKLPPAEVVAYVAEKCGCRVQDLYLLIAPTASPVGSVQIAARSVETGLHKMLELGYDLGRIQNGLGIAPLPPPAGDDMTALGRTNDAVLYGATVYYNVRDTDDTLLPLIEQVPSCSSRDYGTAFQELYERYGNFYAIDPLLFSPASVWLHNNTTGRTFRKGGPRPDLLRKSFRIED